MKEFFVLRESIKNNARNVLLSPILKSEDEITDADREWARTHIVSVDNKRNVDTDYLDRLAKKYAKAKKKNPDIPYGGF